MDPMFDFSEHKFRKADNIGTDTFPVINPSTGAHLADIYRSREPDAINALEIAHTFHRKWKRVPVEERADALEAWAKLLKENVKVLVETVHLEMGKKRSEAQGEVMQCAALLENQASSARKELSITPPSEDGVIRKEGAGVTYAITPWNFPMASVVVKVGAALVTGCPVILKPAEDTPLVALRLATLAYKAGIPLAAFQILTTDRPKEISDILLQSSKVRMVSFTGSISVGKQIMQKCGNTIKKLGLELGGNAPFIVMEDADIKSAAQAAIGAKFYNSGQICIGANRFLVRESVLKTFTEELQHLVDKLEVGPDKDIGPMINMEAARRINHLVEEARRHGAQTVYRKSTGELGEQFVEPTILTGITPDMAIYNTEIFGPIIAIRVIPDHISNDSVWDMANDTDAGLAGYLFTSDSKIEEAGAENLEVGMLGVNTADICRAHLPFGGVKQSGIGHEGGPEPLSDFLVNKCLVKKGQ